MKVKCFVGLVSLILILSMATPVFASGGGHLWFYSQDPGTLNAPDLLPNPEDYDPNYVGNVADSWTTEGVVISSADWSAPFDIWLGCSHFESLDTMLVISINDAAFAAINSITVSTSSISEEITAAEWIDNTPATLSPHGIFNSVEFYGYAEVNVGDLYSPPGTPYVVKITITIDLKDDADLTNAKIHFDAYGYTEDEKLIFNPYSHDATFVVPELGTLLMFTAPAAAFGIYALRRRLK